MRLNSAEDFDELLAIVVEVAEHLVDVSQDLGPVKRASIRATAEHARQLRRRREFG